MDILQNLLQIHQAIQANDPLLQRGIKPDWVCVIHPEMEYHLRQFVPEISHGVNRIESVTRRETWILNSAPRDKLEYMPKAEMFGRYADEFLAKARLAAMFKEDEENTEEDAP